MILVDSENSALGEKTSIIEFMNILVYEYFCINLDIVWRVVEQDLPNLKAQTESIMQEL
jgi:uncharacterized protein with HEPN domain